MQYYCPLNKKIHIAKQKDMLYLLTTKSQHLYRFPDLAQETFLGCRAKHQPGPLTDIRDPPGQWWPAPEWSSFSYCCIKTTMSKRLPPQVRASLLTSVGWRLYIQIPLELRWVQIQGWLLSLAEIHDVAPQLPPSIPGPHLRLQLHQASPPAWGAPPETPLSCCALSPGQSAQLLQLLWLWLPSQPDFWNDSAQGINKIEFPPWGRGMSSRWAVRIPAPCCHSPRLSLPYITRN